MSVNLSKGAKIDLHKASQDAGVTTPLTKVVAGAGWDVTDGKDIDLDLLSIKLGADGKAIADANNNGTNADEAVNFYNNLATKGAVHSGDNLTGEGDGDDEQITYTLADIEAEVMEIAIVVAAFTDKVSFSDVNNVKARVLNADGNTELAVYTNSDLGSGHAVEVGRLTRNGDNWEFTAKGEILSAADGKNGVELMNAIFANYGVTN